MTTQEFYEMTGIRMMNGSTLWWFITEQYNKYPSDKVAFCAQFMRRYNKKGLAQLIEDLDAYIEKAKDDRCIQFKEELNAERKRNEENRHNVSVLEFQLAATRAKLKETEERIADLQAKLQQIRMLVAY